MIKLNSKNTFILIFLLLALIGTTVLAANYAVQYFSEAEEPTDTNRLLNNLPTPTLKFSVCNRIRGKRSSDPGYLSSYDANNNKIIDPSDCNMLQ